MLWCGEVMGSAFLPAATRFQSIRYAEVITLNYSAETAGFNYSAVQNQTSL